MFAISWSVVNGEWEGGNYLRLEHVDAFLNLGEVVRDNVDVPRQLFWFLL